MASAAVHLLSVVSPDNELCNTLLALQIERETTAGAPLGQVISGVVQRTLTTLAQGASQTPSAAGAAAAGPAPAASEPAGARTAATAPAPATLSQPSAAATAAATSAPAAGTSASTSGPSQQPRGLGGGLRPTLPAKRKTPPAAAVTAAAADGAAPSTSTAGTGEAAEAAGSFGTPRQRLAPVQTSGEGRAGSGSSTPGSPGGDRRKSLTRTPTPGLLRYALGPAYGNIHLCFDLVGATSVQHANMAWSDLTVTSMESDGLLDEHVASPHLHYALQADRIWALYATW